MTDHLTELRTVLRVPADGGDAIDWESLRRDSGWSFPADYRQFVQTYGMGAIDDTLAVAAPRFPDYPYADDLLYGVDDAPQPYQSLRWGTNNGGDDFCWVCAPGDPDAWTTRVRIRTGESYDFAMGMVEFLLRLITRNITDAALPLAAALGTPPLTFETWREEDARLLGDE